MESKQIIKIIGIVLTVVGVGLIIWGFQMSQGFGNEMARSLTGSSPDAVMYRYIRGAGSLRVGLFLFFKRS